eukprot:1147863-Pelagomonas_calceolata.AAC.3
MHGIGQIQVLVFLQTANEKHDHRYFNKVLQPMRYQKSQSMTSQLTNLLHAPRQEVLSQCHRAVWVGLASLAAAGGHGHAGCPEGHTWVIAPTFLRRGHRMLQKQKPPVK